MRIENRTGDAVRLEFLTSHVRVRRDIKAGQSIVQEYVTSPPRDRGWSRDGPTFRAFGDSGRAIFCRAMTWEQLDRANWQIVVERGKLEC